MDVAVADGGKENEVFLGDGVDAVALLGWVRSALQELQQQQPFPPGMAAARSLAATLKLEVERCTITSRSLKELQSFELCASVLATVSKVVEEAGQVTAATGRPVLTASRLQALHRAADELCSKLLERQQDPHRTAPTAQEASDVDAERERLQRLLQLYRVESGPSFAYLAAEDQALCAHISKMILGGTLATATAGAQATQDGSGAGGGGGGPSSSGPIDLSSVDASLRRLAAEASVAITAREAVEVRAAVGLPEPQNWKACPNGHAYAVDGCGNPKQSGSCPECKAGIGR